MVVPSGDRLAKWLGKWSGDIVKARFDALKDIATTKQSNMQDAIVEMEIAVEVVLNTDGVVQNDRPKYLNFAREVWHKSEVKGVVNPSLTNQVIAELQPKYVPGLGCALATIRKIAALFNVVIP